MISAVLLSHNEEKEIARAIRSVKFCDEVIVVDDYSDDGTVRTAKRLGARVYQRKLKGNFAVQRNFGLDRARNEWVLFVDADEEVSKELKDEVLRVTGPSRVNGYYLQRRDVFMGQKLWFGETAKVRLVRLAKKGAGKWERPVHEVWKITGQIGTLKAPLIHRPHANLSKFLGSINRYTSIEANFRVQSGGEFGWLELLAYPLAKFGQNYFWRRGLLDGMPGLIMAYFMALHSLVVRIKLYQLGKKNGIID